VLGWRHGRGAQALEVRMPVRLAMFPQQTQMARVFG
jgi:hypothetical protein